MVLNQLIMAYDKTKSRRLNGQTPQIKSHNILSLFGPLIVATAMLKEIGTGDNKQILCSHNKNLWSGDMSVLVSISSDII